MKDATTDEVGRRSGGQYANSHASLVHTFKTLSDDAQIRSV